MYKLKDPVLATDFFAPDIVYMVSRQCTPEWHVREGYYGTCVLTYLTRGAARYYLDGTAHEVTAGDMLYTPPDCRLEAVTYPENLMHCHSVSFHLKDADGEPGPLPFPPVSRIGVRRDLCKRFTELKNAWTEQTPGYAIKARGLLLLYLHQLFDIILHDRDPEAENERVKKAVRYLAAHYGEKLTVERLAAHVCLSPVYFGALFKREMGVTVHQYLAKVRVRNAENLLSSGEYRVGDAAAECGFADVNHFYRQFKAIRGFPPSRCIPKGNSL